MAVTELTLWNQSISSLKIGTRIEDASEVSREAEECGLFYETVRNVVFRAAPWTSLTSYSRLAQYAAQDDDTWTSVDPPPGWAYAFALPADCLRPRYLSSWGSFIISRVGTKQVLATQEATPILTYTGLVENPALWDTDLFQAVMFALAAAVAPGLTGNTSDLQNMFTLAEQKVLTARANDANLASDQQQSIPDWIAARGQSYFTTSRFIYPYGEFSVQGLTTVG